MLLQYPLRAFICQSCSCSVLEPQLLSFHTLALFHHATAGKGKVGPNVDGLLSFGRSIRSSQRIKETYFKQSLFKASFQLFLVFHSSVGKTTTYKYCASVFLCDSPADWLLLTLLSQDTE